MQAEPVGPARIALDEPASLERREEPRGGARVDAGASRELVDAEGGPACGERVEQRERASDRADGA
jgi:hypothetical protein